MLSRHNRVSVTDASLARQCGNQIILGNAFAFVGPQAFDNPALRWIKNLLGGDARPEPRVVSLLGPEPTALPGATVDPTELPALSLAVATSDKALYREGRDTVNLLVADPLCPGGTVTLDLLLDGASFTRRRLGLDHNGVGTAMLGDLPAGGYEVAVSTAAADDPRCSFTVAEYRLAPLTATMAHRSLDGSELTFGLRLEAFAVPINGEVDLELTERGARLTRWRAAAADGLVQSRCTLEGEGPHALNVQLVDDPSRTATVPIVGSRKAERTLTTFCTLGYEVSGSLLPADGSREVRGVHLVEGAVRTSPLVVERVDTRRLRVEARTAVRAARAVVLDPAAPAARPGALDPGAADHPSKEDERYRKGEGLFKDKRFEESLDAFRRGRGEQENPHPFYAYYEACCLAGMGRKGEAVAALDQAVRDGWRDFEHLSGDEDLANLRGEDGFAALLGRGRREVELGDLAAGATVELDVPGPLSVVALGAYVGDAPWEGWTATLAPAGPPPLVQVDSLCEPGAPATLKVLCEAPDATVHLLVKDARLQTADTPASRLAGQLKGHVEQAGERLDVWHPDQKLSDQPLFETMTGCMPPVAGGAVEFGADEDFDMMVRACEAPPMDMPLPPPSMPMRPPSMPLPSPSMPPPPRAAMPLAAAPMMSAPEPEMAPPAGPPGGPYREPAAQPEPAQIVDEPEVLFAGLVPVKGGAGELTLDLPDAFTDYTVDAFCASPGLDWATASASFSAQKQPFAALDLPAFVHPLDTAEGRLQIGGEGGKLSVSVTRDGQPLALTRDGQPLSDDRTVDGPGATLRFDAVPGDYEAHVFEVGGEGSDRSAGRVEEPGALRSRAKALQLLQPGQRLLLADIDGAMTLRVMPGLNRPFTALVQATGDYSHACCEQTAAKILAALALLIMARDAASKARALAIILAGIKRERRMWLRGRGFKMYPHSSDSPDGYLGPLAARYLQQLALAPRDGELGRAAGQALEMAADACGAYGIPWPPSRPRTCQEAYALARFGQGAGAVAAASVKARLSDGLLPSAPSGMPGAVGMRAEGAYAAACMLRAGPAELGQALALANMVVRDLGSTGRLYSTVDSTAAIALMTELRAAGVVSEGGAGTVKVNGQQMPLAQAAGLLEPVQEVEAVDGVAAVEVTRLTEDRWEDYAAGVSLRVALERDGKPRRTFRPGDPLDLHVTIEGGYKAGDLLWVCLPDCLSRVLGGGQVKRFSVDFAEQSELRVPWPPPASRPGASSASRSACATCSRRSGRGTRACWTWRSGLSALSIEVDQPFCPRARALAFSFQQSAFRSPGGRLMLFAPACLRNLRRHGMTQSPSIDDLLQAGERATSKLTADRLPLTADRLSPMHRDAPWSISNQPDRGARWASGVRLQGCLISRYRW